MVIYTSTEKYKNIIYKLNKKLNGINSATLNEEKKYLLIKSTLIVMKTAHCFHV